MILTVIAVVWFVCSVLTYGLSLAMFQKSFPLLGYRKDGIDWEIIPFAILGPFGLGGFLIGMLIDSDFRGHGFMLRTFSVEELTRRANEMHPGLGWTEEDITKAR